MLSDLISIRFSSASNFWFNYSLVGAGERNVGFYEYKYQLSFLLLHADMSSEDLNGKEERTVNPVDNIGGIKFFRDAHISQKMFSSLQNINDDFHHIS